MPVSTLRGVSRTDEAPVADIAPTPAELARLLVERPVCWQWAAFASVLFQRFSAMEQRRMAVALGRRGQSRVKLGTDLQVATCVGEVMRSVDDTVEARETFLRAPAFMAAFGEPGDDDTVDAQGIVHLANRLMDFYDRHLETAEDARDFQVAARHADLARDCALFTYAPIRDFKEFVNDVLQRFAEMRRRVASGERDVELPPVLMGATIHHTLIWSILDRLNELG